MPVLLHRNWRLLALAPLAVFAASCARHPMMSDEECMTRAMYFESNRSSEDGMLAVGTVVMNRVASGRYPRSVCGVVGQKNQFAPGVLSKRMGKGRDLAQKTARTVLRGRKHPAVGKAMFFHTAGYSYPYNNMEYVAILGGNAFYEKRKNATTTQEDVRQRQAAREGRLPYDPPERHLAPAPVAVPVEAYPPFEAVRLPPEPGTPSPVPVRRYQAIEPAPRPATATRRYQPQRLEPFEPMSIEEIIAIQDAKAGRP